MDIKKVVEIPLPNFLYKFLKGYLNPSQEIDLPFHLPTPLTKSDAIVSKYFQTAQKKKYKSIKFLCIRHNIAHQYGVIRLCNQMFYTQAFIFIDTHVKTYFDIKIAVQLFFNQHNISEDDFKMETFLKKYQRFRKRPKHQRLFF